MTIIINQGTQDTEDGGFKQAYNNMVQFMIDCEIPIFIIKSNHTPEDDGRYLFTIKSSLSDKWTWEIEMPAIPLEQVRYIDPNTQRISEFPRLYVDGSSWVWKFAIITKENIVSMLENEIEDMEGTIEKNKKLIIELK